MIQKLQWAAQWLCKCPNVPMPDVMKQTYLDNKTVVDLLVAERRQEEEAEILQRRQLMMGSTAKF